MFFSSHYQINYSISIETHPRCG